VERAQSHADGRDWLPFVRLLAVVDHEARLPRLSFSIYRVV